MEHIDHRARGEPKDESEAGAPDRYRYARLGITFTDKEWERRCAPAGG
jgi:hypothetical protein